MSATPKPWRRYLNEVDLPEDDKILNGIVSQISQNADSIFSNPKPPARNYSDVVLSRISKQISSQPMVGTSADLKKDRGFLKVSLPRLLASFSFVLGIAALSVWVKMNTKILNSESEALVELAKNLQTTGDEKAQIWLASIGNAEDRMDIVGGNWAHEFSLADDSGKSGIETLRTLESALKTQNPSL